MTSVTGWAVRSGNLLVKTVSDTRRAALVNYLVVKHGVAITCFTTDEDIERMWAHYGQHSDVVQVRIVEMGVQK